MAAALEGTFTAQLQESEIIKLTDSVFNVSIRFSSPGRIALQRRFDDADPWRDVLVVTDNFEGNGLEPERAVQYRFICTAYNGDIDYRIGAASARSNVR